MNVNVAAEIRKIYVDDDKFFESDRMKSSFDRLFAPFAVADHPHQQNFAAQLSATFLDILNGGFFRTLKPQTSLSLHEKADAFIRAACPYPKLMTALKYSLFETNKAHWRCGAEDFWKDHQGVPFFEVLIKYPELLHGTETFIKRHLLAKPEFHLTLKQIEGTPYNRVVTVEIMDALKAKMAAAPMNRGNGLRTGALKSSPLYWPLFEGKVSDFFCAYTPHVRQDQVPRIVLSRFLGSGYLVDHDPQRQFMCIKFDEIVDQDSPSLSTRRLRLIKNTEYLRGHYKLLKHAFDILNGDAQGTTINQAWIRHQRQYLMPALACDVAVLTKELKSRRVDIPSWSPVAVPMMDTGIVQYSPAPKRGLFPSP